MSTIIQVPFQFSAEQMAILEADRLATNANGSAWNGAQFATDAEWLTYLLGYGTMGRYFQSLAPVYNLPVPDDMVAGDSSDGDTYPAPSI